ncbi:PilN domain-containing protein [Haemophilus parainfluenzae]|uniref:PilN domain-containing protein n=1 Tax=Haemophilus parainfluenzae TaxID=729 RepID=UPI001FB48AFA|nr:competence protein ComB [Haemophilus parainfluenzae]MDU3250702.1 competence protein ComB [Haemophilus parainfluenzae]MDU5637579.1 competence protein ComB [Haemophilus parainfluenzae]MDU5698522.1 competence protein ComB [Haemophilus parainfluenzae]MDU6976328.1 competence protein ComB [Haemophilus parainfluenzae]
MMLSLNLLPWRLEQHQKAVRRFMWQGLIWLACSVLIVVGLSHLNEQQVYALNQTKEKLAQITNQVHKKRIQVQQLQSNLKEMNELTEMDTEYVYRMLNLLSELPLQQGELDVFTLNAKQVALSGITENQQEFEAIHQFLKHHFTEVNLTKFQPVQQQLFFQFDIHLSESVQ